MTLQVSFRQAARTEFIEAAAWYESKRPLLGVEFVAEIERCVALAAEQPQLHAVAYRGLRRIICGGFRMAFISVSRRSALLLWQSFTAAGIQQSGRAEVDS